MFSIRMWKIKASPQEWPISNSKNLGPSDPKRLMNFHRKRSMNRYKGKNLRYLSKMKWPIFTSVPLFSDLSNL